MADCNELVKVMALVSNNTMEAMGPVKISFGKVLSVSPLSVLVDQKLTLGAAQLVLTRNVTDYKISISIDEQTMQLKQSDSKNEYEISATEQEILIHNALQTGEQVILLRQQGGQKYIIIDRVVSV